MFANICNCFVISNTQLERNKRERERVREEREIRSNFRVHNYQQDMNELYNTKRFCLLFYVCFAIFLPSSYLFFSLLSRPLARSLASSFSHQIFINMHKQTCSINSDTISRYQINTVMMLSAFSFSAVSLSPATNTISSPTTHDHLLIRSNRFTVNKHKFQFPFRVYLMEIAGKKSEGIANDTKKKQKMQIRSR